MSFGASAFASILGLLYPTETAGQNWTSPLNEARLVFARSRYAQITTLEDVEEEDIGTLRYRIGGRPSVDRFGIDAGRYEELVHAGIEILRAQYQVWLENNPSFFETDSQDSRGGPLADYGPEAYFWYWVGREYPESRPNILRDIERIERIIDGPNPFIFREDREDDWLAEWASYYSRVYEMASIRYYEQGCDVY